MLVFFQQVCGGSFSLKFTETLSCSDLSNGDAPLYPFLFSNEFLGLLNCPFYKLLATTFPLPLPMRVLCSFFFPVLVILELTAGIAFSHNFITKSYMSAFKWHRPAFQDLC